ncbi:MAG TPA: CarD family transcriptional regulator, partial [Gammaproteobacteria bacterium]|nr:CarD family transcriptional regulator [Gammaproteobacteria bacterium]
MDTPRRLLDNLRLPDRAHPVIRCGRLYGAAAGLAVAEAARTTPGTVCAIADTANRAEQLVRELEFFAPEKRTHRFSDYETLPYDAFSAPQELLADRLATLHDLAQGTAEIVVVNAEALLSRLPPVGFVESRSLTLRVGQRLDTQRLRSTLITHGYLHVEQVVEPGEFAVRGSLLDVFAAGADAPVRIDLLDDEIEGLRRFDPDTQRTTGRLEELRLLPAREFPFDADAIREFRQRFRIAIPGDPQRASIYREISDAQLPAGIEYYLPLFFDSTASLLDYVSGDALCVLVGDAAAALEDAWRLVNERHEQLGGDAERPILRPAEAFWDPAEIGRRLAGRLVLRLQSPALDDADQVTAFNAESAHPLDGAGQPLGDPIARWLGEESATRVLIATSSRGRRETVKDLLAGRGLGVSSVATWQEFLSSSSSPSVTVAELDEGLYLPRSGIRILTAEQLKLEKPRQSRRRRRGARDPEAIVRELTDLRIGAPVVHEEYGIGRYQGLSTLDVDGLTTEFLTLEYADGDKLYVPVHSLQLVTRYTGAAPEHAPLHRLGSDQWLKAKRKAAERARDVAAELLEIYARRAARQGNAYAWPADAYASFAAEFPFQETSD